MIRKKLPPPKKQYTWQDLPRNLRVVKFDEDDFVWAAQTYIAMHLTNMGFPVDIISKTFDRRQRGDMWSSHKHEGYLFPKKSKRSSKMPGRGKLTIEKRLGKLNYNVLKDIVSSCGWVESDFRTLAYELNREILVDARLIEDKLWSTFIRVDTATQAPVRRKTEEAKLLVLQHLCDLLMHWCRLSYEVAVVVSHAPVRRKHRHSDQILEGFAVTRIAHPKVL